MSHITWAAYDHIIKTLKVSTMAEASMPLAAEWCIQNVKNPQPEPSLSSRKWIWLAQISPSLPSRAGSVRGHPKINNPTVIILTRKTTLTRRSWLVASTWTSWSFMRRLSMDEPRSKARWEFVKTFEIDKVHISPSSRWTQSTIINRLTLYLLAAGSIVDSNSNLLRVAYRTLQLNLKLLNQQEKEELLLNTYRITIIGPTTTAFFRAVSHENKTILSQ